MGPPGAPRAPGPLPLPAITARPRLPVLPAVPGAPAHTKDEAAPGLGSAPGTGRGGAGAALPGGRRSRRSRCVPAVSRASVVVERVWPVPLARAGAAPRLHPRRHRVYRVLRDGKHQPRGDMELLLTRAVQGELSWNLSSGSRYTCWNPAGEGDTNPGLGRGVALGLVPIIVTSRDTCWNPAGEGGHKSLG
uniref:Large ribosomal subunit protein bL9m N-terminal domain-containing protein n=1 Tax=Junco hyemalis TaxID=40217 RepID=A0A8C5J4U6_JUNHY